MESRSFAHVFVLTGKVACYFDLAIQIPHLSFVSIWNISEPAENPYIE